MNIRHAGITLIALAFLMAGTAAAELTPEAGAKITGLQKSLDSRGARWTAGETEVSNLTEDQWSTLTGLDINAPSGPLAPEPPETRLLASLDWRDNGGNFVTAPKRQGSCGSCWSFAMTGALESYVMRKRGEPGMGIDLSEQVYISCSSVGSCKGGVLFPLFLVRQGLPAESAYPYAEADGSCSNAASGWERGAHKIGGWGMVLPTVKKIKAALAHYGPLPTSMMVYEDFLHYKKGIYSRVSGKPLGAHAVLLVGYNDAGEYFIVKNSWGTGWGEDGFFRIDYSEMSSRVIFGLTTVAYY
ncbi:MAG: putative cysteine peptidase [Elusimicrobia bacterium]|nr:MAG: putative cysteine peptidase [Elusimicrobiota bacterium]KAF0152504.1 MAG: putative cysteine peptidase [Elusimicrobiota bacterium]